MTENANTLINSDKKTGNPNWVKGAASPNPAGARVLKQQSALTVKGRLLRFISNEFSPAKMKKLFKTMTPKEQLAFYTEALPFLLPRQTQTTVRQTLASQPDEVIDGLYAKVFGEGADVNAAG